MLSIFGRTAAPGRPFLRGLPTASSYSNNLRGRTKQSNIRRNSISLDCFGQEEFYNLRIYLLASQKRFRKGEEHAKTEKCESFKPIVSLTTCFSTNFYA